LSEAVLVQLAGIVVLGVCAQWLAWRLRLPAILLLLLTGLFAGPGTGWMARHHWLFHAQMLDPNALLGDLLLPAVSLSVALILFEGGLTLNIRQLRGVGNVVWRLITIGSLITWVLTATAAHYIIGMQMPMAVLLGAVLVVTGPTVIGPLLRHVKPIGPVGPVLKWEGIVIDPIGAMLAVVVFEVIANGPLKPPAIVMIVAETIGVGTIVGLAAAGAMIILFRRRLVPDNLQSPLALALVFLAFAVANAIHGESGLFAVTALGLIIANQHLINVRHVMEFKENLTVLLISALFVVLGARLEPQQVSAALTWRAGLFVVVMMVIVRPIAVLWCTARSKLNRRERTFLALMAPRGVVAASVSSVFALRLGETGYPGSEQLVPVTFALIFASVTIYGLSARPLARRLGLALPERMGFLIAGADPLARQIGKLLSEEKHEVMLADTSRENVRAARLEGLRAIDVSILSGDAEEAVELTSIGRLLALTPNDEVNALACTEFSRLFGRDNVYQLAPPPVATPRKQALSEEHRGRTLFSNTATHAALSARLENGATIKRTPLTREFGYEQFRQKYGPDALVLMSMNKESGEVTVATADEHPTPKAGQVLFVLAETATATEPAAPRALSASSGQKS
jgi:NhaP-type Na+/H+ or K+/H+ antiporter